MLRFEGERSFSLAPDALLARLSDVAFLVACMPDVETVHICASDQARVTIQPGLSFVRGALEVELRLLPQAAPGALGIQLTSRGIGSSADVETHLQMLPADGGGLVRWSAEVVRLGGLLKLAPQGLIRGAAEKVINDAWDRVKQRLEGDRA